MTHPLFSFSLRYVSPARAGGLLLCLLGLASAAFGQSFAPAQTYEAAGPFDKVQSVAVADLNGDGRPDLITSCRDSPNVSVLLNTGGGTFASPLLNKGNANSAGTALGGVAVADVNADGKLDIVTGTFETILVLLGRGDGTFAPFVSYATGRNTNTAGVAVVDVSGDGQPDIVVADTYTQKIRVLLGSGTGTFASPVAYAAGTSTYAGGLAVVDVNADGQLDVLTIDANNFAVQVLLGAGSGTFATARSYPTGANSWPTSLSVGDVNADGKLDIVTANSNVFGTEGAAGVLLGSGSGTFAPITTYSTGLTSRPTSIVLADVTGDGKLDVVSANNNSLNFAASIAVLPGTGAGGFAYGRFYSPSYSGIGTGAASHITIADVSGDGKPDIIAANQAASTLSVLLNAGTFLPISSPILPGQLTIWPNPAKASSTVTLSATQLPLAAHWVEAVLVTTVGQVIGRLTVPVAQGAVQAVLPTANARGFYLLQLRAYDTQGTLVGTMPVQRLNVD